MGRSISSHAGRAIGKISKVTQFSDLGLSAPIADSVRAEGYTEPTPIQAQAIPHILAGRDLLGLAATGTGKTAAFALPILHRLAGANARTQRGTCRALILSPTRELADQIGESFRAYGRNTHTTVAVIVGGVAYGRQTEALTKGVDVLVATPGRLLDHISQGHIRLDAVESFVLDEADHMLDLGFIPAIRKIVRLLPAKRQNLFFSATMPKEIGGLAAEMLKDPERVSVSPPSKPAEKIAQSVQFVEPRQKVAALAKTVGEPGRDRVLVFTRTKRGADKVVRELSRQSISAAAIHGNKSQPQRVRALAGFKDGRSPILVATDIAARGIDVDGVDLVVNYDLPHVPETYVHRIGRTARAGNSGLAISFCGPEDRPLLKAIEKLIGRQIAVANGGTIEPGPAPMPAEETGAGARREGPARSRKRTRRRRPEQSHDTSRTEPHREPRTAPESPGNGLPAFLTAARSKPAATGKSRAARRRQRRESVRAASA
jgi:ATP-dependent RNA helicase RhlE